VYFMLTSCGHPQEREGQAHVDKEGEGVKNIDFCGYHK